MDTTLATVTIISLLLAWAMAIVTRQRLRAERRRSDARLADLMAEREPPDGRAGGPADAELPPRELATGVTAPGEGPMEPGERGRQLTAPAAMAGRPFPRWRRASVAPRLPFAAPDRKRWGGDADARVTGDGGEHARRRVADDDAPPAPATGARPSPRRAGPVPITPAPTHWGHGAAAVAVATLLVAGVYLTERTTLSRVGVHLADRIPLPGVGVHFAGRTPPPRAGADLPVELLSLDHRRQGDYLAVSGSLLNPSGGRERSKLSIAATAFDRSGAIIGTGQTPLPTAALPPGEETPFTISLPSADRIDRYRVSFMEDRSRLPHVDRREP